MRFEINIHVQIITIKQTQSAGSNGKTDSEIIRK